MPHTVDVVVIGCGIAGGIAALRLADAGHRVVLLTRSHDPREANTYYAQGGIVYRGRNDSPQQLADDIFRAGAYRNHPDAVTLLAETGPSLVEQWLIRRLKVPFDREAGTFSLVREGGHSVPRILHAADATGKAIHIALLRALQQHSHVNLYPGHTAVDVIVDRETTTPRCVGVWVLDQRTGQIIPILAPFTILATGGYGYLYARTTNPVTTRGDGVAMAWRAGARVGGLEYVQFHPTAFAHPEAPPFLSSEAVRGAGGRLVHADGSPFMARYAPEWQDLAPRDIVARAIFEEMRTHHLSHVYLDLCSALSAEHIRQRFPTLYLRCLRYGVDITRDLIPVAPAAHYTCGGVQSDLWGRTTLPGLYAVGEVAWTGVHGANRLASTSLLEGLVWGVRAAEDILSMSRPAIPSRIPEKSPPRLHKSPPSTILKTWREQIRQLMWEHVGIVRDAQGLALARERLATLAEAIEAAYSTYGVTDNLVGLRNMVQVALLVTRAAEANPHCEGCHYRADTVQAEAHVR